jgi:hypothetical protein
MSSMTSMTQFWVNYAPAAPFETVDFNELVIDAEKDKGCSPLTHEECHGGSLYCLETNRYSDRSKGSR